MQAKSLRLVPLAANVKFYRILYVDANTTSGVTVMSQLLTLKFIFLPYKDNTSNTKINKH